MKRSIVFIIILVFLGNLCAAQENEGGIRTLFKKKEQKCKVKLGYFVGPEAMYTQFKGRDVFLGGLQFGLSMNHFFSIGLAGCAVLNPGSLWYDKISGQEGAYLAGGYGGLKMEFTVLPKYPVHIGFPILIGGGALTYLQELYDGWGTHLNLSSIDCDAFFVVEPGIRVELNVVKFLRVFAGASYRYSPDLDLMNTSSDLINNFNGVVGLKFGKF